jgi:site-specific recombinase XerD
VEYLSEDALQTLLEQPDAKSRKGFRNQFLMTLMYDTAARCCEILKLKVRDLKINTRHPTALLDGKGNKPRLVPLLSKTVEHYKRYLQMYHPDIDNDSDGYLFYTVIHGIKRPMSDDNVADFIKKYGETARLSCPEVPLKVHPHQLRHTRAIHYYRDGMPIAVLSELLGHANPETTKIYAYADTEMKRAAMEKANIMRKVTPVPIPIWEGNEEMILELSGLKSK